MHEPDEIYDPYQKKNIPNPKKPRAAPEPEKTVRLAGCRGCLSRLIGILILLLLIIAMPLVLVVVYDVAESRHEEFAPPGQIITVNGQHMHLYCIGEGSPTILLEAGIGNWSIHWGGVQQLLTTTVAARVCSYDRAGYGWSDASPEERNVIKLSNELALLLNNAGENGPFVLVAHSTSAAIARFFAYSYPDKVVGMVLVDAIHENQFAEWYERAFGNSNQAKIAKILAPVRVLRFLDKFVHYDEDAFDGMVLPDYEARVFRAATYTASYWETLIAEYDGLERSAQAMQPVQSLGNIPLAVIINGNRDWDAWPTAEIYIQFANDLVASSTRGSLVTVETGSNHFIYLQDPAIFVAAVGFIVDQAR